MNQLEEINYPKAYAIQSKDDELLKRSTSGGVFGVLARYTLKSGGVVFGAAYSDDYYCVRHIEVDNLEDLMKLHGSKYVLSKVGDSYKKVTERINEGRLVLFTGTPCQIAGLKKQVAVNERLITCDLVCHGTVSPKIYESYIKWLEKKYDSKLVDYSFRHKHNGWKTMTAVARFENGKTYIRRCDADPYYHAFLTNVSLRSCCDNCSYASIPRQGDITLGDFWGVDVEKPKWFDDRGISVVLVNSSKGEHYIKECRREFKLFEEVDIGIPSKYNNIEHGSIIPSEGQDFQKVFMDEGFGAACRKYIKIPVKTRIREAVAPFLPQKLYQFLRRIF